MRQRRFFQRSGMAARLLAAVSLVAFFLAVIATGADHCVEACEQCHERIVAGYPGCSPNLSSHRQLHANSNDGKASSASACPGATCLCHQPRVEPGDHPIHFFDDFALTALKASPSLELEVTEEILHVPKRLV